jgi:sterol desaturase/sphingolipid hydroxylase (fatty acid hydroxylase superfamily)
MPGLLDHEAALRFYGLIGGFGAIAVWEALAPRRLPVPRASGRWLVNITLMLLMSVLVALVFPVLSVGMALLCQARGIGLLNVPALQPLPGWATLPAFALALVALDLGRYGQHVLLHRIPLLWRLHRVHHSDLDYDSTTALRFHPLEALFAVTLQLAVVALVGAPPLAVLAYEIASALVGLFSHGNVRLRERTDRLLRSVLVTPDLHRVHHSSLAAESGANYGGVVPWWDRWLGTYRAQPLLGHDRMSIGLVELRDARATQVGWLLASPLLRLASEVPAAGETEERAPRRAQ